MAAAKKSQGERHICAVCGGPAVRAMRPRVIRYRERRTTIAQPAWWCLACDEGMLDAADAALADRAFAGLRAGVEGVLAPAEIARIRKRLGLSQRRAGALLGGGARAFQRYEAGAVIVSRPMSNLLALLDRNPDLLAELETRERAAAE